MATMLTSCVNSQLAAGILTVGRDVDGRLDDWDTVPVMLSLGPHTVPAVYG